MPHGTSLAHATGQPRHIWRSSSSAACLGSARLVATTIAVLLLSCQGTAQSSQGVVAVSTSPEFLSALENPDISNIVLARDLALVWELEQANHTWVVTRNLTISPHPAYTPSGVYLLLDCSNGTARVRLEPGVTLTFSGLELLGHVLEEGHTLLLVAYSPNATVRLEHVAQRRRASLPLDNLLTSSLAAPRPPGVPGPQKVFAVARWCYNTTEVANYAPQTCSQDVMYSVDWQTVLPLTQSQYFSKDSQVVYGGYLMVEVENAHITDSFVSEECLAHHTQQDCISRLLDQMAKGPIYIRTKASDSNLVKIILALTMLAVAVLLFLYFRRTYIHEREARLRRKRRAKEAMLNDAHNVVFSGMEDNEADWQILPMPVGIVNEDGGAVPATREASVRAEEQATHHDPSNRGAQPGTPTQQQQQEQQLGPPVRLANCAGATAAGIAAVVGAAAPAIAAAAAAAAAAGGLRSGSARASGSASTGAQPSAAVTAARVSAGTTARHSGGSAAPNGTDAAPAAPAGAGAAATAVPAPGAAALDAAAGAGGAAQQQQLDSDTQRDSDGAGRAAKGGDNKDGSSVVQAQDLMDELEELKRDIMAGINDTQLQILAVVGSGAFGTVYKGLWQGLEVAVKTIVFSASSDNRKRALQEAALCQSIGHPNIVATYAVDVQPIGAVHGGTAHAQGALQQSTNMANLLDWRLYIVQEFCDGGPLKKLVQSQALWLDTGPNLVAICELALELSQALTHLHSKSIIHGDLNPNNVLLKVDAGSVSGFRVKVADFGLSVLLPTQKSHMSNLRLGTPFYMSPETAFKGHVGSASDVFSLGVILWELYHGRLAGMRTAEGELRYQPDFPEFPPSCPMAYRKLAHRCLQKQPHNRLHASQVVQRLLEMLDVARTEALQAAQLQWASQASGTSARANGAVGLQLEGQAPAAGGEISPCPPDQGAHAHANGGVPAQQARGQALPAAAERLRLGPDAV